MTKSIPRVIAPVLLLAVMITGCAVPQAKPETVTETATEPATDTATAVATKTATAMATETLPAASPTSPSSCGPYQEVDLKLGTYDCEQYVSAEQIFSCNLSQIPGHRSIFDGYGIMADYPIDKYKGGGLYAQNLGFEDYYVEYFSITSLPEEVQTLLSDRKTLEQGLNNIFENVLMWARSSQVPEAQIQVVRNEFLEDGRLWIELYVDVDMTVLQEATYIFKNSEYFYFVSYETLITYSSKEKFGSQNLSSDVLQSYLVELYSACEFNR